ncbi:MAG: LppX_LprAFG lipoprotein [Gaiellaceae bacterium]
MRRAVLLLLALPFAATACGGMHNGSAVKLTPVAYVHSAAARTAAAPSEHVTLKLTGNTAGQTFTFDGTGDFDTASKLGDLTLTLHAGPVATTIETVLSGTSSYVKSPLLSGKLPGGKTWLAVDLQSALAKQGIDFSQLSSSNPVQTLAQLQAIGDVTAIGTEQLGGVQTTHYRGHIDLAKLPLAAKIPALKSATFGPYDVWIGKDDGYVRKFSTTYSVAVGGQSADFSLEEQLSNFGETVNVTVPPAADVYTPTGG